MVDVRPWLEKEIWRIIRNRKVLKNTSTSMHDIECDLIPPSNTTADLALRNSSDHVICVWGRMPLRDRQETLRAVVTELYELHRLTPRGTEKFSRYRPLVELEVLDSLSRIV